MEHQSQKIVFWIYILNNYNYYQYVINIITYEKNNE